MYLSTPLEMCKAAVRISCSNLHSQTKVVIEVGIVSSHALLVSDSAQSSLDIAMAIAKSYALEKDSSELLLFYKTLLPHLKDPSDTAIQKKAYKVCGDSLSVTARATDDTYLAQTKPLCGLHVDRA